uniref:Transcription initiation factor TFIID subunit 12 n=1 Tax=Parascaris equorum TaxID=6256 RepID=A0A914S3L4_PAREQ
MQVHAYIIIDRPVFHSYRFEDGRVSMPTRKLISTIDQQETYYKIDPDQPNKAHTDQAELAMDAGRGALMNRARLNDLIEQLDPTTILEEDVKDALLEMIDDFVEQVDPLLVITFVTEVPGHIALRAERPLI